eukprot:scaffold2022_cov261-Pinguiococcus_pyrenoidosus.AAC.23
MNTGREGRPRGARSGIPCGFGANGLLGTQMESLLQPLCACAMGYAGFLKCDESQLAKLSWLRPPAGIQQMRHQTKESRPFRFVSLLSSLRAYRSGSNQATVGPQLLENRVRATFLELSSLAAMADTDRRLATELYFKISSTWLAESALALALAAGQSPRHTSHSVKPK